MNIRNTIYISSKKNRYIKDFFFRRKKKAPIYLFNKISPRL